MGVEIDIDGVYGLMSGERQYTLGKWTTRKKDGEKVKTLKDRTYHKDLSSVFRTYKQKKVRRSNAQSFEELLEEVEKVDKKIDEITKELGV